MKKRKTSEKANISVDAGRPAGKSVLPNHGLGQGGLSDEPWMIADHIPQLKNLNPKYIRLFIQEYYGLYPEHNVYNWEKLDATVDAVLKTGAKPLMCICFKPKALYPVIDHKIVHPASYDEWDELIYRLVRHYNVERKDGIIYWEVANEPDIGESGGCPYLFTGEDYSVYYEHTVKAILRADKSAKVGGPALAGWRNSAIPEPWIDHCHKKNVPVDFISWHFYYDDPDTPCSGAVYFRELLKKYPSLKPELMITEWNIDLNWKRKEPEFQVCFIPAAIYHMVKAGVDYSFHYHIRDCHVREDIFRNFFSETGLKFMANWWNEKLQRDGIFDFQGMMRPAYFVFKMLGKMTGDFVRVSSGSGAVKAFATRNRERETYHILAWNFELKTPPSRRVKLSVKNLEYKEWNYMRYSLNMKTESSMENDRMILEKETRGSMSGVEDDFDIPPYGIHFIVIHPC
jgi:xylan 1,4-beta-xylosidase